jgi:hypothetical protein
MPSLLSHLLAPRAAPPVAEAVRQSVVFDLRTAHAGLPSPEPGGKEAVFISRFRDDAHFHFSHLFSAVDVLFDSWLDRLFY